MDTPQTKKDDFVIGDIQVKTMPGSTSGNPPSMKIPDSPATPTPVVAVSQPAPRPLSPMMPGQASVNSSLGQKISQQNNSPISPKVSNKKTTSFILMILLVVILGAGGYWYYAYGQTMLFARQMVLKLDVPYENYKSDFDFILDARLKKDPVIGNLGSNPTEMFMPSMDSVKVSLIGLQHTVGKNFDGNVQISIGAGSAFNFNNSIDYRQLDKDFYFKFNKDFTTDLLSGLLGMNIDLSEFFNKDRWLTYNWGDLDKLSSSDVGLMVNPVNFNLEKKLEERKKMDDYFKLFKLYDIFKIVDTKESKDSGNGKLKKLQLIVKPSKINDLINMLAILDGAYLNNTELKTTQDIKDKVEKDMAKDRSDDPEQFKAIDSLVQNMDIFVWVNTETKSIQGASVIFDGDTIDLGEEKIILTGHYNFLNEIEDNYLITKPEQTITVQQAYENTMKKIMEEKVRTMKQYEEQSINKDTDSDGLSDIMESFYGTDLLKADTDGDGYKDGEEVNNGYNPNGGGELPPLLPKGATSNIKYNQISASDWVKGDSKALVAIIVYSDTDCPYCAKFHETINQVLKDYKGKVKVAYRHFSLTSLHPEAARKAEAIECVGELGGNDKVWAFLDKLFVTTKPTLAQLGDTVSTLGIDKVKFQTCLASGKYASKVTTQSSAAQTAGAMGTPYSLLVKGASVQAINGALPYETVKTMVDSLLK